MAGDRRQGRHQACVRQARVRGGLCAARATTILLAARGMPRVVPTKNVQGGLPMTTRRDFLRGGAAAATGIMFCGCGLFHSAHAQQPARQTLPVTVGGKRIKTIDVHSHCHFHEAGALIGADAAKLQLPPVNGAPDAFIEIEKRLAAMDSQAIDMEVLSVNPFWYDRERDLAEHCATKPDRFAAFASLTLQAPDLAVQELETAVKKQGLKGAAIGDVVN